MRHIASIDRTAYQMEYEQKRKEQNQCVRCGKDKGEAKTHCFECRKKRADAERAKRKTRNKGKRFS